MKIDVKSALKLTYYLMAVDGDISKIEEETFDAIGNELDSSFQKYKIDIINECKNQLNKAIDEDDFYEVVKEGVEDILKKFITSNSNGFYNDLSYDISNFFQIGIAKSTLIWNLLSVAMGDGKYSKEERNLIKFIVRKLDINKSIYLELENKMKTLESIDNEEKWIKTVSKPYNVVDKQIKELSNRRETIIKSLKVLIND